MDTLNLFTIATQTTPNRTALWQTIVNNQSAITFVISIVGFILSLYNFGIGLIHNHIHIRITYKNHLCITGDPKALLIMMNIENLSRLPISISRAFLCVGENRYEFSSMPHFAYERTQRTGDEIHDKVVTHTTELPCPIPALGAVGGFFHVIAPVTNERLLTEPTKIVLWTNRGKRAYKVHMDNEVPHPH